MAKNKEKRHFTRKERLFDVWEKKLITIASSIFKYENLPPNLPQWEIERRLIINGNCVVFKNFVYGVITSNTSLSGVSIYDTANHFNYAQAVIGSKSNLENLKDGVIIYGSSVDKTFWRNGGNIGNLIRYYADILSDVDISRRIALINNRMVTTPTAKSDNALNALRDFYRDLENGELTIPKIQSGVLDSTEDILKSAAKGLNISLLDYDVVQQNVLKMFYQDLGISYGTDKRERLISDEVCAELDSLSGSLRDWLRCRQEGINAVNNLFGTTITVEVNNDVIT